MKKIIYGFAILLTATAFANSSNSSTDLQPQVVEDLFCDAGWADLDDYYDNGGSSGFYAAYLWCEACGCAGDVPMP